MLNPITHKNVKNALPWCVYDSPIRELVERNEICPSARAISLKNHINISAILDTHRKMGGTKKLKGRGVQGTGRAQTMYRKHVRQKEQEQKKGRKQEQEQKQEHAGADQEQ